MPFEAEGYGTFDVSPEGRAWADAACAAAKRAVSDPTVRDANLRHGETWFVGVDILANDGAGRVEGVPWPRQWIDATPSVGPLHRAQVSIIYPGYPKQDPGQSDANHRYRLERGAAHVDGLLPVGPERRRFAAEFHAYILGIHLNACASSPTLIWPGSHHVIRRALVDTIGNQAPEQVDLTEAYHVARREVFDTIRPMALTGPPGAAFLLHRFMLHGTAAWEGPEQTEGRMTAFFRPEFQSAKDWISVP